jgi:hypothetical protein
MHTLQYNLKDKNLQYLPLEESQQVCFVVK